NMASCSIRRRHCFFATTQSASTLRIMRTSMSRRQAPSCRGYAVAGLLTMRAGLSTKSLSAGLRLAPPVRRSATRRLLPTFGNSGRDSVPDDKSSTTSLESATLAHHRQLPFPFQRDYYFSNLFHLSGFLTRFRSKEDLWALQFLRFRLIHASVTSLRSRAKC